MSTVHLVDNYGSSLETATRPIYWNLPAISNQVVMYCLLIISSLVFLNAIGQRYLLWSSGRNRSGKKLPDIKSLTQAFLNIFLQRKTSRDKKAGLFHIFIYLGFLVLFITTTTVLIHHDFGLDVYSGLIYIGLTIGSDLFGLLLLVGIALASHRRYKEKPDKLHISSGDAFMLSLLSWLVIQGFLLEGLRIYASDDPWAHYSFVGLTVSKLFWGISIPAAKILHFSIWWIHAVTVFVFIALIPYTKFFHIISSSLNLLLTDAEKIRGRAPSPGDIEKIMEEAMSGDGEDLSLGIRSLADMNWKERISLDACTSCGRCQEVCPAYNSGKILSPKFLILDSRDHMLKVHSETEYKKDGFLSKVFQVPLLRKIDAYLLHKFLLESSPSLHSDSYSRAKSKLVQDAPKSGIGVLESMFAGEVMDEDVFWSCTTCGACVEVCPVSIEHVDYILETRQNLMLMHGKLPSEAQPIMRAIESQGTPMGSQGERSDWTAGLDIRFLQAGDDVEVLYWVGCISAFDTRKQDIAKSMVSILNASGVSWGMLGNLESCTGDPARRLGDENTFQVQAKKNIGTFQSVTFKTIVTHCPHCLNTIKNEYPEFGNISESTHRVVHHSQYIQELLHKESIKVNADLQKNVTFHDPCYLGRYNDTYDEPRDVLVQIGIKSKEMSSHREKSMCCGAGGGHYWHDMKVGDRVNVLRVEQATETGASTIASACPFCMQMLEDGIKLSDREDSLEVKDIAELVASQLIVSN